MPQIAPRPTVLAQRPSNCFQQFDRPWLKVFGQEEGPQPPLETKIAISEASQSGPNAREEILRRLKWEALGVMARPHGKI